MIELDTFISWQLITKSGPKRLEINHTLSLITVSDLPDKMQVDKLFKFTGFVSESKLIVSYMPIHGLDVQNFLKAYMIDFPDRTRVQIFCGTHGARDGSFGHTSLHEMGDMINQYKQVVAHVLTYDKKRAKIAKEKGIRFDVRFVGELPGFDTYQIHFKELRATLQDMMDSEDPYIVILAFCFTNVSILRDMLMEMGFLAILDSKAERSLLSDGTCHRMTLGQQTPINAAGKDHIRIHTKDELQSAQTKNMFLFGSTGTGKTEILKHLARMRIQFYKRIYKENSQKINCIIGAYRADAKNLMNTFKEDFDDLLKDEKLNVQFKFFGIK